MDINNIAIVRATNVIPFDGVVRTINSTGHLTKYLNTEFGMRLGDLLKSKEGIFPPEDFSRFGEDEYFEKHVKECADITRMYLPYVSDYNSFVLFSINGLVPDDGSHGFANNTFSNKACGIIEYLKYHIDETSILNPTDTAIKGDVTLSNDAVILIHEDVFNMLSEEEKAQLDSLSLTVKPFTGSLKDAIDRELRKNPDFTSEELSLSRSTGGICDSMTSSDVKKVLRDLIKEYGLSDKKYFDLLTSTNKGEAKYEDFKDEYQNAYLVLEYFEKKFLEDLLRFMGREDLASKVDKQYSSKKFIGMVIDEIDKFGIFKYKQFVISYNEMMTQVYKDGKLVKPSEIVSTIKNSKTI